jgi:hypothetical protein
VGTDDDAVNALTAANKLCFRNCGAAEPVVDATEHVIVAVVGKELRQVVVDDCNN